MKIKRLDVYRVSMPLVYPFRTAYGDDDCIESILVRMESHDGYGWGEATPWRAPGYSPEWATGAFALIRDWLAPMLVGQAIASGQELQQRLSGFKGNYFAKAALDTAWWDLYARQRGEPLWQVIGGTGAIAKVGADFGVMESLRELIGVIGEAVEAGFERIKLKFRPGWDVKMVAAVREAFPDTAFHIDCNSAYTLADVEMFQALDDFGLVMIEQPLAHDDLIDHATLQQGIVTPICLDESITSVERARKAISVQACGWINIKPGRVGGLTNALAIHELCAKAEVPCWIGGMLESAVGQCFNIALATLPGVAYPCDIFPSSRFYRQDLGEPEIALSGPGRVTAFDAAGIGCEPRRERLSKSALEHASIA